MWPPSIGRNGGRMKEEKKDVHYFNRPSTSSDAEWAAKIIRNVKRYRAETCGPSSSDHGYSRFQKEEEEQKVHFFNPPSYAPPSNVSPWPQSLTKLFRKPSGVPQPRTQNQFDGTLPEEKSMPHHGDRQPWSTTWESAPSRTEAQTLMDCEEKERARATRLLDLFYAPQHRATYQDHGTVNQSRPDEEHCPILTWHEDRPSNCSTSQPFEFNTAFDESPDDQRFFSTFPYAPEHRGTIQELGTAHQSRPDEKNRPILPWHKDHPSNCPPWKPFDMNTAWEEFQRHSVASTESPEDDASDNQEEEEDYEDDAPEYEQAEEGEAYEDENAESSTPARSMEEIEQEIVDPEYEAALEVDYDEAHVISHEGRSVEPSSSREDQEMQELFDAYMSGDAAQKAEAMAEWIAKFDEKQKKDSSATTGIDHGEEFSRNPHEDDKRRKDIESINNLLKHGNNSPLTAEEEEAAFQEWNPYSRFFEERSLGEPSTSEPREEPANDAASNEQATGRAHLKRAVKRTIHYGK